MEKNSHILYVNSLQLLLSQTFFLDQLSLEEKVQLVKKMTDRMDELKRMSSMEDAQKSFTMESFYFCLIRIMANSGYAPMQEWMENDKSVQDFEKRGDVLLFTTMPDLSKMILKFSSNFVSDN